MEKGGKGEERVVTEGDRGSRDGEGGAGKNM